MTVTLTNEKTGETKLFVDRQHVADYFAENDKAGWPLPDNLPDAKKPNEAYPVSGPEGTSDVGQAEEQQKVEAARRNGTNPNFRESDAEAAAQAKPKADPNTNRASHKVRD